MEKVAELYKLDLEWLLLIKQAKDLGITPEEIRDFLNNSRYSEKSPI